jgi:predicted nucleotidyltransferase
MLTQGSDGVLQACAPHRSPWAGRRISGCSSRLETGIGAPSGWFAASASKTCSRSSLASCVSPRRARHLGNLDAPVAWAFVFGSAASEAGTVSSDIGLLVVSEASDDALVVPIARDALDPLETAQRCQITAPAELCAVAQTEACGTRRLDSIVSFNV